MQSIQFMVKSYWDVVICRNSKAKVVQEKQWACRPKGCLKLNFDASLDDQNNVVCACFIRNDEGSLLGA